MSLSRQLLGLPKNQISIVWGPRERNKVYTWNNEFDLYDCHQKKGDALSQEARADLHSLGEQIFSRGLVRELKPCGV